MKKTFLKIKIKSLASEARIIRAQERKTLKGARYLKDKQGAEPKAEEAYELYNNLREHRVRQVRTEARASQLAYGFLRGKPYYRVENGRDTPPPEAIGKKAQEIASRFRKTGDRPLDQFEAWLADYRITV